MDYTAQLECRPCADNKAMVQGDRYRFTVLTPFLIRMEYSLTGNFEDHATQVVLNRNFSVPPFSTKEKGDLLVLRTEGFTLIYHKDLGFTRSGLQVKAAGNYSLHRSVWRMGEKPDDLRGTARTLDNIDGGIPLDHGIQSRDGWSLMDDTGSLLLTEDGWVRPRPGDETADLYFFAYGHDYLRCLRDYYRLTGAPPLLPRYALGNWWSRYHRYTEWEYKTLMKRFEREEIPFTVSVLDMDWHITQVDPAYGTGWTGYTWNRELIPEPEGFLAWLHENGFHVTLNIHPADGIRPHEACYERLARALDMDPAERETIRFDSSDRKALEAWLRYVLHPLEDEGVDFWWIDWQQGNCSDLPGLDPLWVLNHFCYLDNGRAGKTPLTLSRYAGPGSHRYPIGFSGDTVVSWASLDFQPYFTATAANIGYGWWSHDIGGHMKGSGNEELETRWIQFGAFSPILRLHSSANPFSGKEPWQYGPEAEAVMKKFLRLRHRMIPYLYTMNRISHRDGIPLILPMYYRSPEVPEAYCVPNEYWFGTQMIACPITRPADRALGTAKFAGWLPEGVWFDFFTGMRYEGGRRINFYRPLDRIPVFAKAGAIVPLSGDAGNTAANPRALEIRIFPGADGRFDLYEDDGSGKREECWAKTGLALRWGRGASFTAGPAEGNLPALPQERSYTLSFVGVEEASATAEVDGREVPCSVSYDDAASTLRVTVTKVPVSGKLQVVLGKAAVAGNRPAGRIFDFLRRAQIPDELKETVYGCVQAAERGKNLKFAIGMLQSMGLSDDLLGNLFEILLA